MAEHFVGRDRELAHLMEQLSHATSGDGRRVSFIAGAAGAGKSALLEELTARAHAAHPDLAVATGVCNASTGIGDPYLPFLEILQQLTGQVDAKNVPSQSASRLRRIGQLSADLLVEYAPDLIGTIIPGSSLVVGVAKMAAEKAGLIEKMQARFQAAASGTSSVDATRIMESYTALIRQLAARTPLVLIIDDLQWADAASCALLFHLAQNLREARVLLVGGYRPNDVALGRNGERHPLTPVLNELKRYHGSLVLDLDATDAAQRRAFVDAIVDAEPNRLDESFRAALLAHTNGHALFIVELLRALQERRYLVTDGSGHWITSEDFDWNVLPSRVEGVIEERVGRLQEELRELLRVASVEGENFTVDIVARVTEISERALLKKLGDELEKRHQLVTEGDVEKIGSKWIAHYRFGHALFQQYLYNQLGRREKLMLHGTIAETLEELYASQLELVTVQLAHHYRLAGEGEKAVEFAMRAARRALRIGASSEAIAHTDAILELIQDFEPALRKTIEIDAQLIRGHASSVIKGYDSPETAAAFQRARSVAASRPPQARTVTILFGLWASRIGNLDFAGGEQDALEMLRIAENVDDTNARIHAHESLSLTYYHSGQLALAIEHAQKLMALVEEASVPRYIEQQGKDPRAFGLRSLALCEYIMGDREQALEHQRMMEDFVAATGHPFSIVVAQTFGYLRGFIDRDPAVTLPAARQSLERAQAVGSATYSTLPLMYIAWAEARPGDAAAIAKIEEGFRAFNSNGGRLHHSTYKLMTADGYGAHGRWTEALAATEEAIDVAEKQHEYLLIAELHRMHGDALRALGRTSQARVSYATALERARQQGAGLFARRAEEALLALDGAIVAN